MLKIRQVEGWTTAIDPDPTLIGPRNHRHQVPCDALWARLITPRSR